MTKTRTLTAKRAGVIADDLGHCIGSYVGINGDRWYVGNIFDLARGRKSIQIKGITLFACGKLRGDEYRLFDC